MANLWTQFSNLLPKAPLVIGDVSAVVNGLYYLTLPSGAQIQAKSASAFSVGARVFVKDGVIQGNAPDLDFDEMDV